MTAQIAVKVAGVVTEYEIDDFIANAGTSPKQVYNSSGVLVWSPHNMFVNSATPATQNVTLITGATYTMSVVGTGSLAGSSGASGTATEGSPATFTATGTTGTFTITGTLTRMQLNRGSTPTAYLATTASARIGLALDYNPSTLLARGLYAEPARTNLLLNNETLITQNVTVTATAHTLSFFGTGTLTLSGASTAGPLVGTGANNRVTLTFTPTAGTLTVTVSGTVSRAQLEAGSTASSPIETFGATVTRAVDRYNCTSASINHSATAGSWWVEFQTVASATFLDNRLIAYSSATAPVYMGGTANIRLVDGTQLTRTAVGTMTNGNVHRAAAAFASGDRAITANGFSVAADAGSTTGLLGPTTIHFGNSNGANHLNGWLRKCYYLPRRMANTELQTVTAA